MDITYTIQLHNYWHCGSGLAAGADVDALVIKDKDELPYIPGKTIKGLLREAVDDLLTFENGETTASDDYLKVFGYFDDKDHRLKSESFFENAVLNPGDAEAIKVAHLAQYLYTSVASTAIDVTGVAREHSLRKTQVTLPCTLTGRILDVPQSMQDTIKRAFGMIKNLGLDRNRGLGRCTWTTSSL